MIKSEIISQIKKYFSIKEFVCKDVYNKFGETSWMFIDEKLLETILIIREKLDKPITINNWSIGGSYSQRGIRCNLCKLVKDKTNKGQLYMSAHRQGLAVDFDVQDMTAEQVRNWIKDNIDLLPYNIRLEKDVSWVHLDVFDTNNKLYEFKV